MVLTIGGQNGSYQREVPYSAIENAQDRGPTSYKLRSRTRPDDLSSEYEPAGTSVRALLQTVLHIPVDQVDTLSIQSPYDASYQTVLRRSDGAFDEVGTGDFPYEGGNPPIFYSRGTGQVNFLRPLRSGDVEGTDPADTNVKDRLQGSSLVGTASTEGTVYEPILTATAVKGDPRSFDLVVTGYKGDKPEGDLNYSWDFKDGQTQETTSATTTHAWTSNGRYQVTVTVTTADGGGVATTLVDLAGGATPGDGAGGTSEDGPKNGGSGNGDNAGGTPGKGGSGRAGSGTKGTGTRGTNGTGTGGTAGSTTSSPSAAAAQARRALEQARSQRDGKAKPRADATGGQQVSGVLLDAEAASAVTAPSGSSPRVAPATTRPATDIPADRRWLLAGVPLLLLLLGGARQTRWLTRRLPELPWRTS